MYCILVAGLPASGKTTFSKYLSKKLNIPVISKDEIKEILFDTVGFHSREEKVALGFGSIDTMYYFAESLMQVGLPFILENNFENISKPCLQNLLDNYKYHPVTVLFDGDMKIIYNRFIQRDKSPLRHRGHVVNTEYPERDENPNIVQAIDFEAFEKIFTERGMRDFTIGKNTVRVDCTDFAKLDYDKLVCEIKDKIGS